MHPNRPFSFTDSLGESLGPSDDDATARLTGFLRGAMAWIETSNLGQLLDTMLAAHPGCRALFETADRVDHVGFLLPGWAKPVLSRAATAAGFPLAHRAFPSSLLARELGRIVGQRRLATMIFKAHGQTPAGSPAAFEAFIPAIDDARTEAWIRRGVCNHVAINLRTADRFLRIQNALADAGVRMAAFMYDRAVYLPGEDATISYFDLDGSEHPFRIEIRADGDLTPPD